MYLFYATTSGTCPVFFPFCTSYPPATHTFINLPFYLPISSPAPLILYTVLFPLFYYPQKSGFWTPLKFPDIWALQTSSRVQQVQTSTLEQSRCTSFVPNIRGYFPVTVNFNETNSFPKIALNNLCNPPPPPCPWPTINTKIWYKIYIYIKESYTNLYFIRLY
jgi:hypothetical protein